MSEVCWAPPTPPRPAPISFSSACRSAVPTDRLFTRCAPHSALMWLHGVPHTFSVYSLKN